MLQRLLFRSINVVVFIAVFAQATACGQAPATTAGRATTPASTTGAAGVQSYAEWISNCRKLPPNRSLRGRPPSKDVLPIKEFREFDTVLTAFLELGRSGALKQATNWVGPSPEKDGFFDIRRAYFQKPEGGGSALRFQPFQIGE